MTSQPIDLAARLDDDHRSVLELVPVDLLDLSDIDKTRTGVEALLATIPRPDFPPGLTIEDVFVPGFDGDVDGDAEDDADRGPDVMVRVYRPAELPAGAPALFWIHGGGLVLGSVDMDDAECARRATDLGCLVASVEYRRAPEHRFPVPLQDCYAGLTWLASNSERLGIDAGRIVVGGASAGGGLAASLALMARDKGGPSIAFQLLVYPMLDHRNVTHSSYEIVDPRVWNRDANVAGWAAYLGSSQPREVSPWASPAVASDLAGLPPAYINVGQFDLFLDEDVAYALALQRAGVPVELHVYPGAFHGSNSMVAHAPVSVRWRHDEDAALTAALHSTG